MRLSSLMRTLVADALCHSPLSAPLAHQRMHDSDDRHRPDPASPRKAPEDETAASRRRFLSMTGVGLGAIAGGLAAIPVLGAIFSPLRQPERAWRAVGRVDEFAVGDTVMVTFVDAEPLPWAGFASANAAWLRRESDDEFVAFSMYCTHVGCPVTWRPGAQMFMCPCHGGTFHRDGSVAAGPPPRPLERMEVRVHDGHVELRTMGAPLTG